MTRTLKAGGLAAALFVALAAVTNADPVQAEAALTAPTAHYLDHAGALIDGAAEIAPAIEAPAGPGAVTIDAAAHATASTAAASMLSFADRVLPGAVTLDELVGEYAAREVNDAEQECLANAVYFEARGEPLEGQLAVAEVVLNRTRSGRYPTGICAVVTQPAQFSFIRAGRFPHADRDCEAWRRAVAISRIALDRLTGKLSGDVLWYHADYVAPSWGRRLQRQAKIGLHIFYS